MANDARAALMRLRDAVDALRHGAIMGGERDYVCGLIVSGIEGELAALPADEAAVCEFCNGALGDKSDHGLGECCSVCPTCDGTGMADETAGASASAAGLVEPERHGASEALSELRRALPLALDPRTPLGRTIFGVIDDRIAVYTEAERARKPQPDERDKTILDMIEMHDSTVRVLDEFGMLYDVKALLPDQVRAVCEKLRVEQERAEKAEAALVDARKEVAEMQAANTAAMEMEVEVGDRNRELAEKLRQAEAERDRGAAGRAGRGEGAAGCGAPRAGRYRRRAKGGRR